MTGTRYRPLLGVLALASCVVCVAAHRVVAAQRGTGAARTSAPAPRWPDGRINLGAPMGEKGLWERRNEHLVVNPQSYQADATKSARIHIDQVPLQPWARALTNHRHSLALASEPYTRCKPAGGPRQFMSPYGLEILDLPELQRIYVFNVANAQSYRTIYMDGRSHPNDLQPSYLGHSVGRWDGDTLVIDSVGFNENTWMNRDGLPHTTQLHLAERLTRVNFDTLNYEVTIDDPGAYTAPWTSGYTLGWSKGLELFEYVCQENNISPESMAQGLTSVITP
ncbi:MAG TPA: hypothetical protein VKB50_21960 [Vicinamibacterales bacterium]|nr:hypothetical protein [Vicinamibacterales bacterium]